MASSARLLDVDLFLGHLAKRINVLDGLRGAVFERRFSEITIVDEEALVHRVAYAIANPVEANLVRSHRDWTGLWAFASNTAARRSFTFLHEGRYRRAVARADDAQSVRRADFQETATLEIGTADADLAGAFAAAVKARESTLREAQRGVVGMAQVLEVSPLARPASSSRSPMPLCFAFSSDGWPTFVAGWRSFVHAFRSASERFRRGVLDVTFPRGAFRPSCWSG